MKRLDFTLRPVEPDDLPLITRWMNDPDVDRFWQLAGPEERTVAHVAAVQASNSSAPYIGLLDGVPMSYWELYRADLDPLSQHYPAESHDGGIHLLLGPAESRGRGLGSVLLREVAQRMLDDDELMSRVVAEPDNGNVASIRAFQRAGFRRSAELSLPDKQAALMILPRVIDVAGVGTGPFNLSLAALADPLSDLSARFYEQRSAWSWHPGLLLDEARLQVPFLADLTTLVDPTSRWTFLSYLREHDRLFPFYFSERFHPSRREYDHYCRWVSEQLTSCVFDQRVTRVDWDTDREAFAIHAEGERSLARHVVVGVGTEPVIPECFTDLAGDRVFAAAEYLHRKEALPTAADITIIGSGQTGAEIFLDLLRSGHAESRTLRWLTRSPAFAPMEYSKLGLEKFTPDYTSYFHGLAEPTRERLVPAQWQLYKGISAETIAEIHDELYERGIGRSWPAATLMPNVEVLEAGYDEASRLTLRCRHREQEQDFAVHTDVVILATGYAPRRADFLEGISSLIAWDHRGRYQVDESGRVALTKEIPGRLYVQNAQIHSHGVGAPDLGLGAHRAATILNDLLGRDAYRLPTRTSFTSFGLESLHVPSRSS